jgi:RNA polymerase sigma-70 factor (ECF subfamily)
MLVGDRGRAEELCQDTFSVAFGHLDELRADASLAAWLHGIAFNLARADNARRRRRRGLLSRFRKHVEPGPSPSADAGVMHDEVVARLRRAMDVLTDEQREAYVMRVLEDLPLHECARLMGVPVSTVSYRARRAEALVRARFEEEERR